MQANQSILLIEDDTVDQMTFRRALGEVHPATVLHVCETGEAALAWLSERAEDPPDFIMLDLNMPCLNGFEFLRAVKDEAMLRRIPVVVLTTSPADKDRAESLALGVADYLVKPIEYPRFVSMLETIRRCWLMGSRYEDT